MVKIKCTEEGRPGIYIPEKESLKEYIKSLGFETIHNFIPSGFMMLGADHDLDSVLQDIDSADRLGIFTNGGGNMGHALSVIRNEKLECYDIGNLSNDNLEILDTV